MDKETEFLFEKLLEISLEFGSKSEEVVTFLKDNPKLAKQLRENREEVIEELDAISVGLEYCSLELGVETGLVEQSKLDEFKKKHPDAKQKVDFFRRALKESLEKIDDETVN